MSEVASSLVRAAAIGDRRAFGSALEALLARGEDVVATTAVDLLDELGTVVAALPSSDTPLSTICEAVGRALPRSNAVLGVNRVVLEHVARACVGLSGYAARIAPTYLCMYASLLLATMPLSGDEPDAPLLTAAPQAVEVVAPHIAAAVAGAARGDADAWQQQVSLALSIDAAAADRAARTALRSRLDEPPIPTDGRLEAIVGASMRLAATTQGGPFACPADLFELVIRRALDEPGCVDFVDLREVTFAATQAVALIDLQDALLPPGWGYAVHGPLD